MPSSLPRVSPTPSGPRRPACRRADAWRPPPLAEMPADREPGSPRSGHVTSSKPLAVRHVMCMALDFAAWFPPTGDVLAVTLAVGGVVAAITVTKYFGARSLALYVESLDARSRLLEVDRDLNPVWLGDGGFQDLINLLDAAGPRKYAYLVSVLNTGYRTVQPLGPCVLHLRDHEELQVAPLQSDRPYRVDLEPTSHSVLIDVSVLNRGEMLDMLVGSILPISKDAVVLRIEAEDIPPELRPTPRPAIVWGRGQRLMGLFHLANAIVLFPAAYLCAWVSIEVWPAWRHPSPLSLVKLVVDLFLLLAAVAYSIWGASSMLQGVHRVVFGRPLGSNPTLMDFAWLQSHHRVRQARGLE